MLIKAKRIYEPKKDDNFDIQKVLGEAIQKSIVSSTDQTKQLVSEFERMSSDAGVKKLEEKFYQYIKNLRIEKEEIKQDVYKSIENWVNEIGRRVENHEHKEYLTQEDKDECINSARDMVNEAVAKFDNLFKPFLEQLDTKSDKEHSHEEFAEIGKEIKAVVKWTDGNLKQKAEKKHTHKIRDIEKLKEKLDEKADKDHKHDEYATRQELEFIAMQKARGGGGGGHVIQETGVVKAQRSNLNFIGATVTDDPDNNATVVTVTGGSGGQASIEFQDEGIGLGTSGTVTEVDFTGAGVTASRAGNKVTVDITGGGGGVSDGDKGDITVSVGGTVWEVNAGVIEESNLNSSVNTSLDLADSSTQPGDNVSSLTNDAGYTTNTGTVTSVAISGSDGLEVDSGSPITGAGTIALGVNKTNMLSHLNVEDGADVTDATNVASAGAFMKAVDDTDDITVGATNKFATAAEKTKLGYITVTQAVDLDTMESDISNKQPLDSDLTTIAGLTATTDNFMQAKAGAWASRTIAQVKSDLGLTGTNSGDQTSIVGITGTKAEFDTAVTDGNFLYVGDITQYTDELAQDAVGAMVDASLNYVDGTPLLQRAALTGAITATAGSNTTTLGSFTTADLNTALSDNNIATGGGTATGTNTGDQNLFSTISVSGQSNVVADSTGDTLTLVAGTNVTITTDAGTDSVTINASGGGTPGGTDTQIQFNDGGSFGGIPEITRDKTLKNFVLNTSEDGSGVYINASNTAGTEYSAITMAENSFYFAVTDSATYSSSCSMDIVGTYFTSTGAVGFNSGTGLYDFGESTNTYYGKLDFDNITADRTYTFPNASGTIALVTGTSDAITTGTIELGHATDTTISRVSAGVVAIEGVNIVTESAAQSLTNKSVNGVTLVTGGTATKYLSEDGTYTAPAGGGSPGGSDTQIQYNDSGSFAGATNVKIENDGLRLDHTTTPTTPSAGGHILFNRAVANRQMPAFIGPSGLDSVLQPFLARNKVGYRCPPGNATTFPGVLGFTAPTITGFTATARTVATTNLFTRMRRLGYVTATTAGTVGHRRHAAGQFTVGGGGGGGFTYITRFGISDPATVAGARMFMGMRLSATPTNVEPNTLTNCIGLGHGASDTNMKLFYGGSSAQTPIDLGANFPITANSVNVYELALFSSPTSGYVHYQVTRLDTGDVATGTIVNSGATVLPTNTTLLAIRGYRTNNATALAVGLDVMSAYIETDY